MAARRAPVAVLGGSFDRLHAGHRALLAAGFAAARRVGIGITTDAFLAAHPKPFADRIQPFEVRRRALRRYLRRTYGEGRWWLVPLDDPWGRSVQPGVDVLVASRETEQGTQAVNRERRRRGLPPVQVKLVDLVLADDGFPISSRRIRSGVIAPNGRRLLPLELRTFGVTPSIRPQVRAAFASVLPGLQVRATPARGRARRRTLRPASVRDRAAGAASEALGRADYAVSLIRAAPGSPRSARTSDWIAVASSQGVRVRPVPRDRPSGLRLAVTAALRDLLRS
jgi:pantetheine-phosphate adenylyltransferase